MLGFGFRVLGLGMFSLMLAVLNRDSTTPYSNEHPKV